MKLSITSIAALVAGLFITTQAQASFFQTYCSNAEATVQTAGGHLKSGITLTHRDYTDEGKVDTKVEDTTHNLTLTSEDGPVIESRNTNSCEGSNETHGIASWHKTYVEKVTITKRDDTLFDKRILGVSQDQKSVTAALICEEFGNSQVFCGR